MGLWSRLFGGVNHQGVRPNDNAPPSSVGPGHNPGDPNGVQFVKTPVQARSFATFSPSPWDGWPGQWSTPNWDWGARYNALVDIAWLCIDMSAMALSAMPVYRTRGNKVIDPKTWMFNPDPFTYTSWHEFAKQLFRDYMMGEAFVLPIVNGADGYPFTFRVVPPWIIDVEMVGARRVYRLGGRGGRDVTDEILHIRYDSATDQPRGRGPLEVAGGRQITAGLIEKYAREVVSTGGHSDVWIESEESLSEDEAQDLLNQYMTSRRQNLGAPPVFDNGATLKSMSRMSPKDLTLLEVGQFTEARIAILLGVPPGLVGLPTGDSLTYANISQIFDQHDRLSLRPKAAHVMGALSQWALPSTQAAELNRDEYSRPGFAERADANVKYVQAGVLSTDEVRTAERFQGEGPNEPTQAVAAITGGNQ